MLSRRALVIGATIMVAVSLGAGGLLGRGPESTPDQPEAARAAAAGRAARPSARAADLGCELRIRVVDAEGHPSEGCAVNVLTEALSLAGTTADDGIATLDVPESTPRAACRAPAELTLTTRSGTRRRWIRHLDPDLPVEVRLPGLRSATLQVIDDEGEVQAVELAVRNAPDPEPLGLGTFRLRAEAATVDVVVAANDAPLQRATIPLDGRSHTLTLALTREVEVEARCPAEGCTRPLSCDGRTCRPQPGATPEAASWRCACTEGERGAALVLLGGSPEPVGWLAPAVDWVELDLSDWSASVVGVWAGGAPCRVAVYPPHGGGAMGECAADGTFRVDGAPTGPVTVSVEGDATRAVVEVDLNAGETTDVGELRPRSVVVHGQIDADFSLDDATFDAMPLTGSLGQTGGFTVDVGREGDPVQLSLLSPEFGAFHLTTAARDGMVWTLRWAENRDTWLDRPTGR